MYIIILYGSTMYIHIEKGVSVTDHTWGNSCTKCCDNPQRRVLSCLSRDCIWHVHIQTWIYWDEPERATQGSTMVATPVTCYFYMAYIYLCLIFFTFFLAFFLHTLKLSKSYLICPTTSNVMHKAKLHTLRHSLTLCFHFSLHTSTTQTMLSFYIHFAQAHPKWCLVSH